MGTCAAADQNSLNLGAFVRLGVNNLAKAVAKAANPRDIER